MGTKSRYWTDCISEAASDCKLELSPEQLKCLADAVEISHENYGLAFHSPSNSDIYESMKRDWEQNFKRLEAEYEAYKDSAKDAIKKALHLRPDSLVSIKSHGEVFTHGGRTTQVQ